MAPSGCSVNVFSVENWQEDYLRWPRSQVQSMARPVTIAEEGKPASRSWDPGWTTQGHFRAGTQHAGHTQSCVGFSGLP